MHPIPRSCLRPYNVDRHVVSFIPTVLAVMLLLSSLLLVVSSVTAIAFIPDAASIPADAGVPLVPDVLTVAGLPSTVASLAL
jgi:hypothetical protein